MVRPLPFPVPDPRRLRYDRQGESLRQLCESVVDLELETQELEQNLLAFERYYLGRVQHHYALLDRVQVELLEERLARDGTDAEILRDLELEKRKAEASRAAIPHDEPEPAWSPTEAPPELKALYRQVARAVHPDLAVAPGETRLRHAYMSELNTALRAGDVDRMLDMLETWEAAVVDVHEELGEAIARMALRIDRAWKRRILLEQELEDLRGSVMALLMACVRDAEAGGRDVIGSVIERIGTEIEALRAERDRLRGTAGR